MRDTLTTITLCALMVLCSFGCGWANEAADVAQDEFGAGASLDKYEWFIDQANAIEKMDADVDLYEGRVTSVEEQYASYGEDIAEWPPHIQMQYNREVQMARDDLASIASQRNGLVKEYNAASEKFNWAPFETNPDKPEESYHEYVVP